jgi:hypothetical protein
MLFETVFCPLQNRLENPSFAGTFRRTKNAPHAKQIACGAFVQRR